MPEKTSTPPLISLLIVAYGAEPYLDETLSSVVAQTYPHWEALIVDGDSPDRVADIALRWQQTDSRIRFFHTPDEGVNGGRNFAARQSRGQFLMALDGDDRLAPGYLETCLRAFDDPVVKASLCQWQFFGADFPPSPLKYTCYEDLLMMNAIHVTTMVRREDYFRIGGFDENTLLLLDDWDFWIRLLDGQPDGALVMNPAPLFHYRRRPGSRLTKMDDPQIRADFQRYMYQKHVHRYRSHFGDAVTPPMIAYIPAESIRLLVPPINSDSAPTRISTLIYACMGCALRDFPVESCMAYLKAASAKISPHLPSALPHLSPLYRRLAKLLTKDPASFIRKVRRRETLRAPFRALYHRLRNHSSFPTTLVFIIPSAIIFTPF